MRAFYENRNDDFYCRDSSRKGKTLGYISHLHRHIELALVKAGKTHVLIDSEEYIVEAGDIIVVFPNQIHRFETIEREQYILLLVNPDLIPEFSKQLTTTVPVSNLIKGAVFDSELLSLIESMSSTYYGNDPYKDMILRGYLLAFFGKLLQKTELRDVQSCDYHVIGTILNYCIQNSNKDLSLSMLENDLHISKYYISHVMSSKLHIGFNDYINSLRISNACKYLLRTDKSMTEISDIVGFNTLRTFNRAFFKQMGLTPSDYRAKMQNDNFVPSVPIR